MCIHRCKQEICVQKFVGKVYGEIELWNISCTPSHSVAQWLACTYWGGVWWVVASGTTSSAWAVNLHMGTCHSLLWKRQFTAAFSDASPVYRCWAAPKSVSRGLLAAPTVCAGMCHGLQLGWDIMTSGNRMGGCDSTCIERKRLARDGAGEERQELQPSSPLDLTFEFPVRGNVGDGCKNQSKNSRVKDVCYLCLALTVHFWAQIHFPH